MTGKDPLHVEWTTPLINSLALSSLLCTKGWIQSYKPPRSGLFSWFGDPSASEVILIFCVIVPQIWPDPINPLARCHIDPCSKNLRSSSNYQTSIPVGSKCVGPILLLAHVGILISSAQVPCPSNAMRNLS